jgi:cobalamin synthase
MILDDVSSFYKLKKTITVNASYFIYSMSPRLPVSYHYLFDFYEQYSGNMMISIAFIAIIIIIIIIIIIMLNNFFFGLLTNFLVLFYSPK